MSRPVRGAGRWPILGLTHTGDLALFSFKKKTDSVKEIQATYDKVLKYKRAEWVLAAFYRKGYVLVDTSAEARELSTAVAS